MISPSPQFIFRSQSQSEQRPNKNTLNLKSNSHCINLDLGSVAVNLSDWPFTLNMFKKPRECPLCILTQTQFRGAGVGVLGVWIGGGETALEEHHGIEHLCTVCGDTGSVQTWYWHASAVIRSQVVSCKHVYLHLLKMRSNLTSINSCVCILNESRVCSHLNVELTNCDPNMESDVSFRSEQDLGCLSELIWGGRMSTFHISSVLNL